MLQNHYNSYIFHLTIERRCGVEVERSPRMREIEVRSPVATDLNCKNR